MTSDPKRRNDPFKGEPFTHESLDHAEFDLLLPAPGDPALPADRHTLLKEHLMDEITRTAPAAARPRLRRTAWIALPVAATLVASAMAISQWGPGADAHDGVRAGGATAEPEVLRLEPGTTEGLPAAVERISLAAAKQPALEPRADQFIYVESKVSFLRGENNNGKEKNWITPIHQRQIWKSPDGTKGFLYEPGHGLIDKKGEDLDDGEHGTGDHRHSYNSLKALPTDPDALLKRLYQGGKPGDHDADWMAFKEIGQLLQEQIAPPSTSAALYKAAARIPGVTLVDRTVDAAGRPGIAIAFTIGDSRKEWVFDKNTYDYLGQREVLLKAAYGMEPGTVTGQTTVVRRAVVDAKKELPDGRKVSA
ncbi:CU044_5270 family protein [Streptomyces olivoreticuli]